MTTMPNPHVLERGISDRLEMVQKRSDADEHHAPTHDTDPHGFPGSTSLWPRLCGTLPEIIVWRISTLSGRLETCLFEALTGMIGKPCSFPLWPAEASFQLSIVRATEHAKHLSPSLLNSSLSGKVYTASYDISACPARRKSRTSKRNRRWPFHSSASN
jgi:hypothetical protein